MASNILTVNALDDKILDTVSDLYYSRLTHFDIALNNTGLPAALATAYR